MAIIEQSQRTQGLPQLGRLLKSLRSVSGRAPLRNSGSAAFNPLTDLPWVAVWVAGTNTFSTGSTPATNGQTVQNWGDALGNTLILTQADGGLRPVYESTSSGLNNKPAVKGVSPSALRWARGGALATPYTVVVIGKFPSGVTGYSTLVANETTVYTYVWTGVDTTNYESTYQGNIFARNYNSQANVWTAGIATSGATASRFGRNGANIVGQITANTLSGITLFSYGSADGLYSEGEVAFVGILPDITNNIANWSQFLRYVETNFGIAITTGNLVITDGDSRTTGSSDITGNQEGAAGYIDKQFGLTWSYLLQTDVTNPLQVVGMGWSGRTGAQANTDFPDYILPIVNESLAANKILIYINAGINDVVNNGNTAIQAYAVMVTYVATAHAAGLKVLLGTSATFTTITVPQEAARVALNLLVTTNGASGGVGGANADGIVDIAGDSITPQSNNPLNPNFNPSNFNTDGTHWSVAGNVVVEGLVKTALAAAPFNVT